VTTGAGKTRDDHGLLARFVEVRHPNIVEIFDWGEVDGASFLVKELLRGDTLASLLGQTAKLPLARAEGICFDTAASSSPWTPFERSEVVCEVGDCSPTRVRGLTTRIPRGTCSSTWRHRGLASEEPDASSILARHVGTSAAAKRGAGILPARTAAFSVSGQGSAKSGNERNEFVTESVRLAVLQGLVTSVTL
jgi:hypothetical protein